jgi:hypothetical protein
MARGDSPTGSEEPGTGAELERIRNKLRRLHDELLQREPLSAPDPSGEEEPGDAGSSGGSGRPLGQ